MRQFGQAEMAILQSKLRSITQGYTANASYTSLLLHLRKFFIRHDLAAMYECMATLTIVDEKLGGGGQKVVAMTIECLDENMSVKDIIRERIYQEVSDYNQRIDTESDSPAPKFLVTPTELEKKLNNKTSKLAPGKAKKQKFVNWEKQYELACSAFESNGFFVLIADKQASDLEEIFTIAVDTEISFIKLTPLVGG
jgi:hypothetical protein